MEDKKMERCQRCEELLKPGKEVWLNLNSDTGLYSLNQILIEKDDQGAFPFGKTCASKVINNGGEL